MAFTLDLNLIFQTLLIAVLVGVGRSVWSTSVTIAKLAAVLEMHVKADEHVHAELREAVHDLRNP